MKMNRWLISFICITSMRMSFAQEESVRVGPGKAVEAIDKDGGFKLSAKALKSIEVVLRTVEGPTFEIPKEAIVYYGVQVGVYRRRKEMFQLVPVKIQKKSTTTVTARSEEVQAKDEIAVAGAALLRVSEMDAFGGEE